MTQTLDRLDDSFYRVAGHFRVAGLLDVGTQCCVARLEDGNWVMLDSYTLDDAVLADVRELTGGGPHAVLNLHPFHTLHCAWAHRAFPDAKLYGTARHHRVLPELPWQTSRCEDGALAATFGDSFGFSVPAGVPLVCEDESVHFSSVLALHRASGTLHVDDTLTYLRKGFPLSLLPVVGKLAFHPTLAKALKREPGAADAFAEWARALADEWQDTRRVAAAHNAVLETDRGEFSRLVTTALERVRPVLDAHRQAHG